MDQIIDSYSIIKFNKKKNKKIKLNLIILYYILSALCVGHD